MFCVPKKKTDLSEGSFEVLAMIAEACEEMHPDVVGLVCKAFRAGSRSMRWTPNRVLTSAEDVEKARAMYPNAKWSVTISFANSHEIGVALYEAGLQRLGAVKVLCWNKLKFDISMLRKVKSMDSFTSRKNVIGITNENVDILACAKRVALFSSTVSDLQPLLRSGSHVRRLSLRLPLLKTLAPVEGSKIERIKVDSDRRATYTPALDLTPLAHIERVSIIGEFRNYQMLCSVPRLSIKVFYRDPFDVSPFDCVKHLTLTYCIIPNVAPLARIPHLVLSGCDIDDISPLASVPHLVLHGAADGTDVSCLRNVRHLELLECESVVGIEHLGNHDTLAISENNILRDVSPFAGVHKELKLWSCSGIIDISSLASVPVVKLWGCASVQDVSPLRAATELEIDDCPLVHDVTSFSSVQALSLSRLSLITDISTLTNVERLTIENCHSISKADVAFLEQCSQRNITIEYYS